MKLLTINPSFRDLNKAPEDPQMTLLELLGIYKPSTLLKKPTTSSESKPSNYQKNHSKFAVKLFYKLKSENRGVKNNKYLILIFLRCIL